jgi:hypothetical protein
MDKSHIPILAEVLELYYTHDEFMEMASIFDVTFSKGAIWGRTQTFNWLAAARQLVERIDHGNHYKMRESLLTALEQRNKTAIARTDWERRDAHQCATPKIAQLAAALGEPGVAREIVVAEEKPFTAKAEVREFLERAETSTLVVDAYIGVGTLDCFRTMKVPIRLLTACRTTRSRRVLKMHSRLSRPRDSKSRSGATPSSTIVTSLSTSDAG